MKRLLPLLVLAGCRTAAAPAPANPPEVDALTRVPDEAPAVAVDRPTGGFVVFATSETYVIPVDPTAEVQMYPDLFIGDGNGGGTFKIPLELVESAKGKALHLPYCADAVAEEACGRLGEDDYVDGLAKLGPDGVSVATVAGDGACDCIAVEGVSDDGRERYLADLVRSTGLTEEELGYSDLGIEEFIAVCYDDRLDLTTVSLSGGVLHSHEMVSSMDCGGLNTYYLESRNDELREGATWKPFDVDEGFMCTEYLDLNVPLADLEQFDGCAYGEDDCCPEAGEGMAQRILSGAMIQFAGDATPVGDECGCIKTLPLSLDLCGPFDPCGSADGLPGLKGAVAWWAATDGSAGLGLTEAGDLQVFVPGAATFVRGEDLDVALEDVDGVEFLPVIPASEPEVIQMVVVDVPSSEEMPKKSWGNLCFQRFKQGKLDAAEAACYEGLLENTGSHDDNARGALLYSMGRIEEARGHKGRARLYYERSLEVRPRNAAVAKRLAEL